MQRKRGYLNITTEIVMGRKTIAIEWKKGGRFQRDALFGSVRRAECQLKAYKLATPKV